MNLPGYFNALTYIFGHSRYFFLSFINLGFEPIAACQLHCAKTYIPTTWESIGYADGNVLNPAN